MSYKHYETLEIKWNATDTDIKNAYRRLALKFHPGINNKPGSVERFAQLGEAYDVLGDPRKKGIYDLYGDEGVKGGVPDKSGSSEAPSSKYVYHGNPDRTFREFFGSDNPFEGASPDQLDMMKIQDSPIERDLDLSLDDLFFGCIKRIPVPSTDKFLTVEVKPGWEEGRRILFPKERDQGLNPIPVDMVYIVKQLSHPLFVRHHNDLIFRQKISLSMALTGFTVKVPTLDGKLLTIPIHDIVHPNYKKVVPGEGMPLPKDPSQPMDPLQRGNLVLTFDTQFPKSLSAESKALIQKALDDPSQLMDPLQRRNIVLTFDTQFPKSLSAKSKALIQKALDDEK